MVEELRAGGRPWFLTLLTVGTHYPFNIPADYTAATGTSDEERAFTYQDEAVGAFMAALHESRALEETLVLIVSDESAGVARGVDDLTRLLSQAWGYLAAITPSGERLRLESPILQADISLSVLDYVGLGDRSAGFAGRSLFRRYAAPRPVAFGNTFLRSVGLFNGSGRLVVCREDLTGCLAYRTAEGRPFAPGIEPIGPAAGADVGFLRGLIARSRIAPPAGTRALTAGTPSTDTTWTLIAARRFAVREGLYGRQLISGGQGLAIAATTRIEVDLDITVIGGEGQVVLTHVLAAESQGRRTLHQEATPLLQPGDRFRLRYNYTTEIDLPRVDCDLFVTLIDGHDLALDIGRATLRTAPAPQAGDESAPFELVLREITSSR
jgi:hypothetical protein